MDGMTTREMVSVGTTLIMAAAAALGLNDARGSRQDNTDQVAAIDRFTENRSCVKVPEDEFCEVVLTNCRPKRTLSGGSSSEGSM